MKSTIISALALLAILVSCSNKTTKTETQTPAGQPAVVAPGPVITQELTGYFLKNTYQQKEDVKLLIFNNETSFKDVFGMGKTMTNQIIEPDFATSFVGAIAMKSTPMQTTITLEKANIENGTCNVYVNVKTGEKQSFTSTPVYIFTLEKAIPAKQVQLFVNGEKKDLVSF